MRVAATGALICLLSIVTGAAAWGTQAVATGNPNAPTCSPAWTIVPTPGGGSSDSLYGVDALSPTDGWSVGSHYDGVTDSGLAEHWDGAAWAVVDTPRLGTATYLEDVVQIGPADAWAVGYRTNQSGKPLTLALHWDGTAWKAAYTPSPGAISSYLVAATATSPSDVWAVGYQVTGAAVYRTLALHWDGSIWSMVATPNVGIDDNLLQGVSAIGADDAWAAGWFDAQGGTRSLVEHWDGNSWSVVPSPDPSPTVNTLFDVHAVSTTDVWAVGSDNDGSDNVSLIERWDGSAWSVVPSPNVPDSGNVLNELASASSGDVWAVGYYYPTVGERQFETLALHWDGASWILVPSPDPSADADSYLRAVSALPDGQVWAVGSATAGATVERLCEVTLTDAGFSTRAATIPGGFAATWTFPASNLQAHSITDATGLDLFDSGLRAPESSFVFTFPGAGTYQVADQPTGRTMAVRAGVVVTPTSGGTTTPFTIAWALEAAPVGLVFDVQVRRPGAQGFEDWKLAQTVPQATFIPHAGPGTYGFRARLRRTSDQHTTRWSPPAAIRVHA